jgi:pyridoxamine 5'-phosphate oxidase
MSFLKALNVKSEFTLEIAVLRFIEPTHLFDELPNRLLIIHWCSSVTDSSKADFAPAGKRWNLTKHGESRIEIGMEISAKTNPLALFDDWMKEAKEHKGIREATAMALATMNASGGLGIRVVLCKSWSEEGFVFYTNYASRKGLDLAANPKAAAVFYWDPLFRQVKISGPVVKTSRADSEAYWNSRPRDSQLSQYISRQSEEVGSREELERAWKEADQKFQGVSIPCPAHWGGYIIQADSIEFWIGRPGRLHDRFSFEKAGANWTFRRLNP